MELEENSANSAAVRQMQSVTDDDLRTAAFFVARKAEVDIGHLQDWAIRVAKEKAAARDAPSTTVLPEVNWTFKQDAKLVAK
jgi:hypothetical protein